jgi:hypothetical protein
MSEKKERPISRDEAVVQLWEHAVLDYKLTEPQKIIKKGILEDSSKISVVMCARRLGKSYLALSMAIEACLKVPDTIVKYVFPKQKAAKKNIIPIMKTILEDCPKHLRPIFMAADLLYKFPNGSELQMAGSDNGNIESIRGGNSSLNIVDEAGFCDDLTYAVRSVLAPTTKLTQGRTILVSTPSRYEDHEFVQDWALKYQAEGRIRVFTIFDNPQFTEAIIKDALDDYPDGEKDPGFRREYMCEIVRSADTSILPSFSSDVEKVIVRSDYPRPIFYDSYVSMDIGGSDLTAVLFGYYDYLNATTVIEDELIFGKEVNTKAVAEAIRIKESQLWRNTIDESIIPPYLRIADNNNLIMLTDLQRDHGITFIPTRKDNREAAINALDVALSQHKVVIHPRCTHTLYHMKFARWDKNRRNFLKIKDSPSGQIKGGHADALAAIIYLHRNIIKSKNPYPAGYGDVSGSGVFTSQLKKDELKDKSVKSWLSSMVWRKDSTK